MGIGSIQRTTEQVTEQKSSQTPYDARRSIFMCTTTAQILKLFLTARKSRNPKYSIRAFARDLKMTHAMLNMVLAGKRFLSEKLATNVTQRLGLNLIESDYFLALSALDRSNSNEAHLFAKMHVAKMSAKTIQSDQIEMNVPCADVAMNSEWFYFPLLSLVQYSKHFDFCVQKVSHLLGVPAIQIQEVLDRMELDGFAIQNK